MSDEEPEYEVESITQARVEKQRERKKNLIWKYNVRWKGYGPEGDTWEPVESFIGSEHIVERFWARANAGDRDYRDMSLFKAGEEFLPTGPPRRKLKRKSVKSSTAASPPTSPGQMNEKRGRSPAVIEIEDSEDDRPTKRARETPQSAEPFQPKKQQIPLPGRGTKESQKGSQPIPLPRPTRPTPRKTVRASSDDEIVPASDDELEQLNELHVPPLTGKAPTVNADFLEAFAEDENDNPISDVDIGQNNQSQPDVPGPIFDVTKESKPSKIPSHRAKAANPRVKMVDNPSVSDLDGAIAVKARLLGQSTASAPSTSVAPNRVRHASGSKPGPGRSSSGFMNRNTSSLLTFEKGELKTVKGRYQREPQETGNEVSGNPTGAEFMPNGFPQGNEETPGDEIPGFSTPSGAPAPPTAEELLRLAGVDKEKETLSDFEDAGPSSALPVAEPTALPDPSTDTELTTAPVTEYRPDQTPSALQQSLALAKNKLFPSGATAAMDTLGAAWKRSTIFGPLGLGSDSQTKPAFELVNSESSRPSLFLLSLDTSASIPVVLADTSPSPSGSPSLEFIVGKKGPPGKFYSQKSALALLDTVRTGGPSAKIVPDTGSTPDQRSQFELFHSRLSSGELFVAMAGVEVLAFCSSDNALIAQRLNISPLLLGQPGTVLVGRVIIENYSAYADAALDADGRRWHLKNYGAL